MKKQLKADRILKVPPYLFAEIDKKKQAAIERGAKLINLGIGDPDLPTPEHIVRAMHEAIDDPATHDYPPYEGTKEFRSAAAAWYQKRFGVELDPDMEVMSLIGSKEGIAHIFLALVNPGDICLLPDIGYPVYNTGCLFAGGTPHFYQLKEENGFLPDLNSIPKKILAKTKLMFINYPNNPTAATATLAFFKELVAFAEKNKIILCHDLAYGEMTYGNFQAPSILQVPGAKEICIEFNSLSKTYNMTGWRIGIACGGAALISALGIIKTNIDSGVFKAIQRAAVAALTSNQDCVQKNNNIYQKRRDKLVDGLNSLGWKLNPSKATFYIWAPIPKKFKTSAEFCTFMLDECGIVVVPGNGYGSGGEGYFRAAITVTAEKITEAIERMRKKRIAF